MNRYYLSERIFIVEVQRMSEDGGHGSESDLDRA